MKAAAALVVVALLGALTAFALPHAGRAANPKLIATVDDAYTISLTDSDGHAVTNLAPGAYDVEVHDNSALHDFHLTGPGVDESTTVPESTTVTWTVDLAAGSYHFQCDAHPYSMYGDFTVGASATSTGATTTAPATTGTAPPTTTQETTTTTATTTTSPTTTATSPASCRVPRVVGATLAVARRRIVRARCRVGHVATRRSRAARGRVLAQKPRGGTSLRRGGRVALVVSRGRR